MPTSVYYQITPIIEIILALRPSSILDIGAGTGKYGLLIREYLDIWGQKGARYDRSLWKHRIDAVEAYEPYITPVYEYVYNEIFVGDVMEIIHKIPHFYDLALLIDVLEHIEKMQGKHLLKLLTCKSQTILISVPRKVRPQEAIFGNPYEIHRSEWTKRDFLEINPCVFKICQDKLICIMGEKGVRAWRDYNQRKWRSVLKKRFPIAINCVRWLSQALRVFRALL
jgi:hypothetical protein